MARALIAQRALAVLAAAFGVATVVAGTRVLAGADPGYVVFRPLLWFNTAMGLAYLAAAFAIWRDAALGGRAALVIFALNTAVLAAIAVLHLTGEAVATTSLGAMSLRTAFWLSLWLALSQLARRHTASAIV